MLKRLILHGFKSFSDRTELKLGSGITAIVGPNGCGKSNLADALRWVLGEQSTRVLRCQRLHELIFTGAASKRAMGMAEVKILLDGLGGDGEIEIARRFTRDGSSEYRLNGKICRYKDIVETLLGTGLSHLGYVVIGQGTIHELAGGKPEDRRIWIEEASGVARFHLDKKAVENNLAKAGNDIERLNDLLVELEARKAILYSHWQTAKEYKEFVDRRKNTELSMWLYQEREEARKVLSLKRRIDKYVSDYDSIQQTLSSLSSELKALEQSIEPLKAQREQMAGKREDALTWLLNLEKRRDSSRGELSQVKRELEARKARKNAIAEELAGLDAAEKTAGEDRQKLFSLLQEAIDRLNDAEKRRTESEASWKELSENVIALRKDAVLLTETLRGIQKKKEECRRELEEKRKEMAVLRSWLSSAGERFESLEKEMALLKESHGQAAKKKLATEGQMESINKELNSLNPLLEKHASKEKILEQELSSLRARKKLLEEMELSFEGYGKGPRTILNAGRKGTLKGIKGSVGELFTCKAKYISALSAAAGGTVENIVVENEEAAKKGIRYLKENKGGRVTFLPLNLIRPRNLTGQAIYVLDRLEGVRPLLSVIEYAKELEPVARYLFGRVVLADDIEKGLEFMKESKWAAKVVTMNGESIEPGGAISGGDPPRQESLFQRKRELHDLAAGEKTLISGLSVVAGKKESVRSSMDLLTAKIETLREDYALTESDIAGLAGSISRCSSEITSLAGQISQKSSQISPLEAAESDLVLKINELQEKENEISARISQSDAELREKEDVLKDSFSRDKGFSEEIQRLSREKEVIQRQYDAVIRRIGSLLGEKTSLSKSLEEEEKELKRLEEHYSVLNSDEVSLTTQIRETDAELGRIKDELGQTEAQIEEYGSRIASCKVEIEKLTRELAQLQERRRDAGDELDAITASLGETRDLLMVQFGVEVPELYDHPRLPRPQALVAIEELDKQLADLGTVNLKAGEEYKEINNRIQLLSDEKRDIESAITELLNSKELIEKEIQQKFLDTFQKVAQSYEDIFQGLFGGGRGRLVLDEDTYGVEVVAEPPGRKQKQFNSLSGGERSLCGIALILSILSVKASPIIVLDEVDTSLDESNVIRFGQFLKKYAQDTQFLIITHQKSTMEIADVIYGVTMDEPGVSKVFGVSLQNR